MGGGGVQTSSRFEAMRAHAARLKNDTSPALTHVCRHYTLYYMFFRLFEIT